MMPRVHTSSRPYDAYSGEGGSPQSYSVSDTYDEDLDGDITIPIQNAKTPMQVEMNTLDEPIKDTVLRDLKAVATKFRYVLQPRRPESKMLLKEWDLWGPLLLCTFMAIILQSTGGDPDSSQDGGPGFAEVFVIVWVGSLVVTVNSRLLGGNMSIFQSVCVLGYCLIAPAAALVFCQIILLIGDMSTFFFIVRLVIALIAFIWSTASSMVFLGESQAPGRKALAGYPVCLFYAVICWLVVSHTD